MMSPRLLIAACLILAPITASSSAWAQPGSPTSSLDLSLETRPAASRETKGRFTGRSATSSRGGALVRRDTPQQVVLGKLAVVSGNKATIRLGRSSDARLLSVVTKGTYLAIISDIGGYYGVLMVDRTTGWVPKSAVKMIDYQVAMGDPNAAEPPSPPVAADDPSAGLPANLDAHQIALLREAFSYLGVPYVWAGNTRSGLDCSGFVKNVFASRGVRLPRHSGDQARVGMPVAWEELQAGDRLYFDMGNKGRISHTGIYLGNGYFIHASSNQKKVGVDSLLKPNYYRALVGARRS